MSDQTIASDADVLERPRQHRENRKKNIGRKVADNQAQAVAKFIRVPPRKARLVINEVRGKYAQEALAFLRFIPNRAAQYISKVLTSAVANAANNHGLNPENLKLVECARGRRPAHEARAAARSGPRLPHPQAHEPYHGDRGGSGAAPAQAEEVHAPRSARPPLAGCACRHRHSAPIAEDVETTTPVDGRVGTTAPRYRNATHRTKRRRRPIPTRPMRSARP